VLNPLFSGEPIGQALAAQRRKVLEDVAAQPLDVLRTRELDELVAELLTRWRYRPLVLNWNAKKRAESVDEIEIDSDANHETADQTRPGKVTGMAMTLVVPFRGQKGLFHLRPSTPTGHPPRGLVCTNKQILSYAGVGADGPAVRRDLDEQEAAITQWVAWVNREVLAFNDELPELLRSAFQARFDKIREGDDFVAALGTPQATFEIPQAARGVHQQRRPASRRDYIEAPVGESGNLLAQSRLDPHRAAGWSDLLGPKGLSQPKPRGPGRPKGPHAIQTRAEIENAYRDLWTKLGRRPYWNEVARDLGVDDRTLRDAREYFRVNERAIHKPGE
jgi:hypothetical protein